MARRRASTCWSSRGHSGGAMGLCQGGRRLRPAVRVLRDPVVPRKAALEAVGFDPCRDRGAEVREIVLVAQDLASYGRDRTSAVGKPDRTGPGIVELIGAVPSESIGSVCSTFTRPRSAIGSSRRLLGLALPTSISPCSTLRASVAQDAALGGRHQVPRTDRTDPASRAGAVLRSSFILGYPGETEEDHDELLRFIEEASLDWAGFFTFSREDGTLADGLAEQVPSLARPRAPPGVLGVAGGDHGPSAPGAGRDDERSTGRPARPCPSFGKLRRSTASCGCPFCPGRLAGRGPLHAARAGPDLEAVPVPELVAAAAHE